MPRYDPCQKTKQDILEIAMRLFSEKGLENVSVEDVVKELGVTRGAFYHYFKSREELIAGVMYKSFHDNNPFHTVSQRKDLNALEKLHFIIKLDFLPRLEQSDSMRAQMKKMSNNPVVFKNEILSQVNIMSIYIERLLIEGNEDGSMYVAYPKQAAQTIALLVSSWLSPYVFEVSYEEYVDKISFFQQLGELLGVPFMDDEIKELFLTLGKQELLK